MLDMQTRPSEALGALLKRLRQRQRVGQKELGDLAGLSRTLITNLERGTDLDGRPANPRPDTLRRLARGLATDGEGIHHPDAEESFYAELMEAAGYLPARPAWDMALYLRGKVPEEYIGPFVAQWVNAAPGDQKAQADQFVEHCNERRAERSDEMLGRQNRPA